MHCNHGEQRAPCSRRSAIAWAAARDGVEEQEVVHQPQQRRRQRLPPPAGVPSARRQGRWQPAAVQGRPPCSGAVRAAGTRWQTSAVWAVCHLHSGASMMLEKEAFAQGSSIACLLTQHECHQCERLPHRATSTVTREVPSEGHALTVGRTDGLTCGIGKPREPRPGPRIARWRPRPSAPAQRLFWQQAQQGRMHALCGRVSAGAGAAARARPGTGCTAAWTAWSPVPSAGISRTHMHWFVWLNLPLFWTR